MTLRRSTWPLAIALAIGCGPSNPSTLSIEDWCLGMERAVRDRRVACACPGDPETDAALEARCAALPASSLLAAFDRGDVGWNGAVASAWARPREGCDAIELGTDDPVLGSIAPGEPCDVFADAWGAPDDCAYGARCLAPAGGVPVCIAIVGEGESCDDAHACDVGLACDPDASVCTTAAPPSVCGPP